MPTRTPFAAALAAMSLACAGNAAAQTDVLVVEGTSVGTTAAAEFEPYLQIKLENTQGGRDVLLGGRAADTLRKAPNALQQRPGAEEAKYMEFKLREVLISGVIENGKPAQSPGSHRNEIHIESFSWGMSSGAAAGPNLMLQSATGQPVPRGSATGALPQAGPFAFATPGDIKGQGISSVVGGTRAAGGPGVPSMTGQLRK